MTTNMILSCTCYPSDPNTRTRYGDAVEPRSALEPNPGCQVHFPARVETPAHVISTDRQGRFPEIQVLAEKVSILTHDEFVALAGWDMISLMSRDGINAAIAEYLSRDEWAKTQKQARDVLHYLSFTERQEWPYSARHWIYYKAVATLLQDRLPDWLDSLLTSRWDRATEEGGQ